MGIDEGLNHLASVSVADAKLLKIESLNVLQLRLSLPSSRAPPKCLGSCIVQSIVNDEVQYDEPDQHAERIPAISISPLVYDMMCASAIAVLQNEGGDNDIDWSTGDPVAVTPLPVLSALGVTASHDTEQDGDSLCWNARRLKIVKDLPFGSPISISLLHIDEELQQFCEQSGDFMKTLQSTLSFFLQGKIIMEGSTTVIYTEEGTATAVVNLIQVASEGQQDKSNSKASDIAYRPVFGFGEHKLAIESEDFVISCDALEGQSGSAGKVEWRSECPGYENLLQSLIQLCSVQGPAAPTGILLTGSPQVGKTHLASSLAYHLSKASAGVHWVSVQDLLLQATWASESDLLEMLRPTSRPGAEQLQLLVLDDLHIFANQEDTLDAVTLNMDAEMLVVKNAVLQIIDELATKRNNGEMGTGILAIAQSSAALPIGFVKSGRLEKEVVMSPPTESQREVILRNTIPLLSSDDGETTQEFATALTAVTVGCVAGDLRRILSNAWTRAMARRGVEDLESTHQARLSWDDLRQAAQTYVPIQLETVDVCKPKSFLALDAESIQNTRMGAEEWARIHALSWESFGGYPLVKKRLLRTVVGPWRRFLKSLDHLTQPQSSSMGLSPPPGVLFHGESGNGKSFAAECLASSLGLPMIRVKAADVMDKWLGGSEAIIRSLFARARSAAPCILFFDELDSIATNRASGDEGGAELMSRLLSTLLNEMDGISSDKRRQSVLVVACTNRLKDLDAALLRPGRLEEHIHLNHPGATDIREIIRIHLSKVPVSQEVDLDALAQDLATKGASAAEVEGLCHDACLCAIHHTSDSGVLLTLDDLENSIRSSH